MDIIGETINLAALYLLFVIYLTIYFGYPPFLIFPRIDKNKSSSYLFLS